jgi:polyhydroxyalkanoate synthesis regulator phasin
LKQRDLVLAELRKVVQEDHADAKASHGLTNQEQATLNQQENKINGQTNKDVAVDHQALVKWLAEHPRQAEVLRRDWREQDRVDRLYEEGKITAQQRDLIISELRGVAHEDRADATANGGSITKQEQSAMNQQENKINGQVAGDVKTDAAWAQAHPRQAEVLRRDRFEQDRINALVANGQISAAQGKIILAELKDVAQEDHADAAANGGGITKGQQATMNQQENEINAEINTDKPGK